MSVSARSVSPGARLLRGSRLFSIPNPIKPSQADTDPTAKGRSNSATSSFPTHLAITTTAASRANGDWGLKRPLPLRKTTKSTHPLIKVKQLDSIEEITDYQHAGAHTFALRKFQEMHLPLSVPVLSSHTATPHVSVFEEKDDITNITWERQMEGEGRRWRFQGPWLSGMTDAEFDRYLHRSVRGKRAEFRQFLRESLAARKTQEAPPPDAGSSAEIAQPIKAQDITEAEFEEYVRDLREDRYELYRLAGRFLDLAPIALGARLHKLGNLAPDVKKELVSHTYAETGPPATHPSAGLSYLRTNSFMENHPIYGPQKQHAPVEARVLKPRAPREGIYQPSIGVGGFVADKTSSDTTFNLAKSGSRTVDKGLFQLDLAVEGGSKMFLGTHRATVDKNGHAIIKMTDVTHETTLIQKERMGQYKLLQDSMKAQLQAKEAAQKRGRSRRGVDRIGSSTSYGFSSAPTSRPEDSPRGS